MVGVVGVLEAEAGGVVPVLGLLPAPVDEDVDAMLQLRLIPPPFAAPDLDVPVAVAEDALFWGSTFFTVSVEYSDVGVGMSEQDDCA